MLEMDGSYTKVAVAGPILGMVVDPKRLRDWTAKPLPATDCMRDLPATGSTREPDRVGEEMGVEGRPERESFELQLPLKVKRACPPVKLS